MPEQLSYEETARRRSVLREITRRQAEDGVRVAIHHADRARQFMPFAALRGYSSMVQQAQREQCRSGRRGLSPEEVAELSRTLASLRRGDAVVLSVYREQAGAYEELRGSVDEVVPALEALRIADHWVPFADIGALTRE